MVNYQFSTFGANNLRVFFLDWRSVHREIIHPTALTSGFLCSGGIVRLARRSAELFCKALLTSVK